MIDKKDGEYRLLLDNQIVIYTLIIEDKELKDIELNTNFVQEIIDLIIRKNKKIKSKINKENELYKLRKNLNSMHSKIQLSKEDIIGLEIMKYLEDDLLMKDIDYIYLRKLENIIKELSDTIAKKNIKYNRLNKPIIDDYYLLLKQKLEYLINYLSILGKEANSKDLLDKIKYIRSLLVNEYNNLDNNLTIYATNIKNQTYLKNINILSNAIYNLIMNNYLDYIDLNTDKISIMEVLDTIPEYIIYLVYMDIITDTRTKTLINIYKIINDICLKEDNTKYTEEEINKYILIKMKENKELIEEDNKKRTL